MPGRFVARRSRRGWPFPPHHRRRILPRSAWSERRVW